jgi:hypothetical protein
MGEQIASEKRHNPWTSVPASLPHAHGTVVGRVGESSRGDERPNATCRMTSSNAEIPIGDRALPLENLLLRRRLSTVDFPKDEPKLIKRLDDDEANMVTHGRQHFSFPVRSGEVAGINTSNTKGTHIGSDCGSLKEVLDVTRLHRVYEVVDASIAKLWQAGPAFHVLRSACRHSGRDPSHIDPRSLPNLVPSPPRSAP